MNERIEAFLRDIESESPQSPERVEILRTLLVKFVELATFDSDLGDLRVAVNALNELLEASTLFDQWREHSKLAVFGSARTKPDNPLFEMARQLGAVMAERGWMTVSGAGPGIMEASAMGAGRGHTLGVNIELPFEQFVNPFIDAETMLVAMQYFFTRKVAMTRPSNAFAIFPGGLGTMDETFEVLTLLHTGKTTPAPVVLLDTPDGTFWRQWMDFIENAIITDDYIGPHDMCRHQGAPPPHYGATGRTGERAAALRPGSGLRARGRPHDQLRLRRTQLCEPAPVDQPDQRVGRLVPTRPA
jgi:uncharacterized protein (TIGR00730 family)